MNNKNDIITIPRDKCLKDFEVYKNINYKKDKSDDDTLSKNLKQEEIDLINEIKELKYENNNNLYRYSFFRGIKERENKLKLKYGGPRYTCGIVINNNFYSFAEYDTFCYLVKKKNKIHLNKNYKKLDKKDIPKIIKEEINKYYCKINKKIEMLVKKGVPYSLYENIIKKWLTIGDINKLKKGEELMMLNFDRNIGDTIGNDKTIQTLKLYDPKYFFKNAWVKYYHNKDLMGKIFYAWQTMDDYKNNSEENKPFKFTFDIEYKSNHWYPLDKNGYLPAKSADFGNILLDGKKKHWSNFPSNTRIGWRGPMVIWNKLDNLPKVFYDWD